MKDDVLFHVRRPQPTWRMAVVSLIFVLAVLAMVPAVAASTLTISPAAGSSLGGTPVTITGADYSLTGNTTVTFGGTAATGVVVVSTTQITATAPAHVAGVVDVVVNSAGSASTLTSAYTFVDAPTVTLINTTIGSMEGSTPVRITGTNLLTATSVQFGGVQNTTPFAGVTATTIDVLTPAHAAGDVGVTVYTPGGSASLNSTAFSYAGPITVASISPVTGPIAGTNTVTIIGTGFVRNDAAIKVNFTSAISDSNAVTGTFVNSTAITAIAPAHAAATVNVNVTTTGGYALKEAFYQFVNPPFTSSITPSSGSSYGSDSITIAGSNLTASTVTIGGLSATGVSVNSAGTSITATTPANATALASFTVPVKVTALGGTNSTLTYTYNVPLPNMTSISPVSGSTAGNTTLTITGNNLTRATSVKINGVQNVTPFISNSQTQIVVLTPSSSVRGSFNVNVTTVAGTTVDAAGSNAFEYTAAVPAITSVSPVVGPLAGRTVNLTGTGFTGATSVTFEGVSAAPVYVFNDTYIGCTAPVRATAGAVNIIVTTPGGAITGQNLYTYVVAPTISSVSPISGSRNGGTLLTITGTGFTSLGTTNVTFDGIAGTGVSVVSATSIKAYTPANATAVAAVGVTVENAGGSATKASAFTYNAGPAITRIEPMNGTISGSTEVVITGTNLTGVTSVTFDGMPATNWSGMITATSIQARTPAHAAGPVAVIVSTPSGSATSPIQFTYVGVPTIVSISPATGNPSTITDVTITGTSFTGVTSVTFDGAPANNMTVVNDTVITATAPAHAAGVVSVVITAPQGTATGTFTYAVVTAPTVTLVAPATGSVLGGTPVTITGTQFTGATSVKFGSTAATTFNVVSATSITATSPAGSAGVVNVTVTTSAGTSATSTHSEFTYVVVPTGTSTVGVFRSGSVYLAGSNTNGGAPVNAFSYGMDDDVPVVGQWTTTQTAKTIGIFRGSNGMFYLRNTNNNGVADTKFNFGQAGDVPVSGHWSGAGSDTVGVFRTGTFFLAGSNVNGGGTVNAFNYGMSTDVPVAGDWTGTGTTKVGIFRSGLWALASSNVAGGGTPTYITFGQAGDVPVTGDWNADGVTEVGVFRNGMIYQATPAGALSGYFYYGMTNDLPVGGYFG